LTAKNYGSFDRLHEKVQRWVWDQGWATLREVQELAIPHVLAQDRDVLIAAATASGKTEAAFLPICSQIATKPATGIQCIYLSPLKALINDQYRRMEELFERIEVPVTKWHGDAPAGPKKKLLDHPKGILLITPESLEAMCMNHGSKLVDMFGGTKYVVIDEMHSFLGTERGKQLQSLIHRIEITIERDIPIVGLSATLGDMEKARTFLHPSKNFPCKIIESKKDGNKLDIAIFGYVLEELKEDEENEEYASPIFLDLFQRLRGKSNLVFANGRKDVEQAADALRELCEQKRLPNEFFPHHGNLSKELREDVEALLKKNEQPCSAVCTSTLEMGIDIGKVDSVSQIGTPPSVASLRQRLGRSGRRGKPPILEEYIEEDKITPDAHPFSCLRARLVQTIAMVDLLLAGWYETPNVKKHHFSTLIQQMLALVFQYGGAKANSLWQILCKTGPFNNVTQRQFIALLQCLGKRKFLEQAENGQLFLTPKAERLVNHYSFYAAFKTEEEYKLMSKEKTLGSMPIYRLLREGEYLIFAGRRWIIVKVDVDKKLIELVPSRGGQPPKFSGEFPFVDDAVCQRMLQIYLSNYVPEYLDLTSRELLTEGRLYFNKYNLARKKLMKHRDELLWIAFRGDVIMNTLCLLLNYHGLKASSEGIGLSVGKADETSFLAVVSKLVKSDPIHPLELVKGTKKKGSEKYDYLLSQVLLNEEVVRIFIDLDEAYKTLKQIMIGHCEHS